MIELNVKGMTCGHCVTSVTRAIKSVDAGADVQVDLGTGRVRVEGRSTPQELTGALGAAGYPAALATGTPQPRAKRSGCCCG
jgi:copper chaperone